MSASTADRQAWKGVGRRTRSGSDARPPANRDRGGRLLGRTSAARAEENECLTRHNDRMENPRLIDLANWPRRQLFESIDDARLVYERIAADASTLQVPAGGNAPVLADADQLPTSEKIRRGLAAARTRH